MDMAPAQFAGIAVVLALWCACRAGIVKMAPVSHPDVEGPLVARWDADSGAFWFELAILRLSRWEMPCASVSGWFCGRDRGSVDFVSRQLAAEH